MKIKLAYALCSLLLLARVVYSAEASNRTPNETLHVFKAGEDGTAKNLNANFDVISGQIKALQDENKALQKKLAEGGATTTSPALGVSVSTISVDVYLKPNPKVKPDENKFLAPTEAWDDSMNLTLPANLKNKKLLAVWATFGGNGLENIGYLRQASFGLTPDQKQVTIWLRQTGEMPKSAERIQIQVHVLAMQ